MKNIFDISRPKFIVTTPELLIKLQEWVPDIDPDRIILFDAQQPESCASVGRPPHDIKSKNTIKSLRSHGQRDWRKLQTTEAMKETPAAFFLTSGTTGCPKLAVLSHYSMVAHFSQIHQDVPYDVIRLGCLPLFHMFGGAWALALTIRHGQPMYIMPRFILETYLEHVERYKITESYVAPPIVLRLNELGPTVQSQLASLRFVGVGGAPITAGAMRSFRSMLHKDATLSGVYGATEIGTVCMLQYGEDDDSGCVGRPLPGVKISLRLSEARREPPNSQREGLEVLGEVVVAAESHMMRYRESSQNRDVDVQWYRTGDLGCLEDGKLYIIGKAKDIMKVNG
jgi:acyl-CoA synthetase (AMP-forming)/AMP-acid ligase II